MLDFKNPQEITAQLSVEATQYIETFLQKIFDSLTSEHTWPWSASCEYPDHFDIEKTDPGKFISPLISFEVEYDCFSDIHFRFINDIPESMIEFRLISDCLLKNGFVRTDNSFLHFVRNIAQH